VAQLESDAASALQLFRNSDVELKGKVTAQAFGTMPESIPLDFNGSEGVFFAPFGVQNEATLKSNSPDVGFRDAFLPAK
jgi:inner membrane protein involved in colicin E2 resistance